MVSHDYTYGPVRPCRPLREPRPPIKQCALCNKSDGALFRCEGGHICQNCMDAGRRGRDATTKAVRLLKNADELIKNTKEIDPVLRDAVLTKRGEIANLLVHTVAQDAHAHRLDLLDRVSTDAIALALDAENSIQPANSAERMLVHQLAITHKTALEIISKAMLEDDSVERARALNVAVRFMDLYQRGLLTFQRLRTGGAQNITVHYTTVGEGGQAIVGDVRTGGRNQK